VYALVAAGIGVAIGTAAARSNAVRAALEVARLPTPRPIEDDRHTPDNTVQFMTRAHAARTGAHP
jgi:hypothetical protein